jgi:hypothetical protein
MDTDISIDSTVDQKVATFFRRVDWSAFWTACVLSFIVYFYTLAPTVTLEDSGELAVAGDCLGVPHPPGYPIWTMCAWLFSRIFSFVGYMGQPNPAWAQGLMSAVFGSLATGITAMLICRSGFDLLQKSWSATHKAGQTMENLICWTGGVVCSLLFAFSPVMWSQAVIVEVYSLNALFLVAIFLLSYKWMKQPSDKLLYVTAFIFGLGLTNYQVLLLAALSLVIVIMLKDTELFRDLLIIGIPFIVTVMILKLANMPSQLGFPKPHMFPPNLRPPPIGDGTFFAMFLAGTFVVVMCIIAARMRKTDEWPIIPIILLSVGLLTLFLIVASIPASPPHPPTHVQPGQPAPVPFSWNAYFLGFVGAMIVLVALCLTVPKRGPLIAIALVTMEMAFAILLAKGALRDLVHPPHTWNILLHPSKYSWWFIFYVFYDFLLLSVAFFALPRGRTVAFTFLLAQLGASFYVYMPIVSDLRWPLPMNWGYPRTWEGFKHAVTRGQYEKFNPSNVFSSGFLDQMGHYLVDLRRQFYLPIALLGFLPFTVWEIKIGNRRIKALNVVLALSALAVFLMFFQPAEWRLDKIFISGVILALVVGTTLIMINLAKENISKLTKPSESTPEEKVIAVGLLAGSVLAYLGLIVMLIVGIDGVTEPLRNPQAKLASGQIKDIFTTSGALVLMMLAPALMFAAVTWLTRSRYDLKMSIDLNSQKWIVATLSGFLVMSVPLIVLANPKGDIQDTFIQKVKFISSHALYAFWIGYGLIFALGSIDALVRSKAVKYSCLAVALLLPLAPLYKNWHDPEILKIYGGAEQNGHNFGWQFGNYQLRGADAISEEINNSDTEPLPNPEYPPEMTPDAIFFGGTDPGRFVPTYMIYGADVRSDVFLITQNALADNTYMAVMRDLYGNDIWIPAQPDSAKAFKRYVEEIQSGKRKRNAQLKIENGRVQVQGAIGVMEINGILCEMIFEHNKYRHDFYVEESYVIPWMFPYMTPHGLIMKINDKKTPIPNQVMRDDLDFWDWYTRYLTGNPKFRHDIAARKSFSKLRSALAGLYSARALGFASQRNMPMAAAMFERSEIAFQQARTLYSLSPEANFRLAQEVLLRQNRLADVRDMINLFYKEDPLCIKAKQFLDQLSSQERMINRLKALEAKMPKIEINDAFELANIYLRLGNRGKFKSLMSNIATSKMHPSLMFRAAELLFRGRELALMTKVLDNCYSNLPPQTPADVYLKIFQMRAATDKKPAMKESLAAYLRKKPADWRAWLDMASLNMTLKDGQGTTYALNNAAKYGGNEAMAQINRDQRFAPFRKKIRTGPQAPINMPNGGLPNLPRLRSQPPGR